MTKQDEINHLEKFVSELENGYLSDIFKDILPMITDAIRSDFCCIPMRDVWKQKSEYYHEMIEYKNQSTTIKQDIQKLEENKRCLENEVKTIRENLSKIASRIYGL